MIRVLAAMAALAVAAPAAIAAAHDFTPGVLAMVEREPGRFEIGWTPPVDSGVELEVSFLLPGHCRLDGELRWADCGSEGVHGEIQFPGLRDHRAGVVVRITSLDADPIEHLVGGDAPTLSLDRTPGDSFLAWMRLGLEHIAFGFDHLAFLIGLLLITGASRKAILTVTAFTIAHSLTLALATLDVVRLAAAPVEATIAASILLVARESLTPATATDAAAGTVTARHPHLVAALFGLIHGLGFAGALREIGLPQSSIALPLLAFNLGVELGQLAIVAAAILAARLVSTPPRWLRPAAAYAIGALGACWLLGRILDILLRVPS